MISQKKDEIKIKGTFPELSADYTLITTNLYEMFAKRIGEEQAKEQLKQCFECAFKTPEELIDEIEDGMVDFLESMLGDRYE